jgi:hypothetical protein
VTFLTVGSLMIVIDDTKAGAKDKAKARQDTFIVQGSHDDHHMTIIMY